MDMEDIHLHINQMHIQVKFLLIVLFKTLFFFSQSYIACGSLTCKNGGICQYMGSSGYQCKCDSSGRWLGNDCSKRKIYF